MRRIVLLATGVLCAMVLAGASAADSCACGGFNPHAYDSGCQVQYIVPEGYPPGYTYQCWNPWNGSHLHIWF